MSNVLVSLKRSQAPVRSGPERILLVKPPFFTPWTPPLGISILKAFLQQQGFPATCFDYNTDSVLWGTHHKYFAALQSLESVSLNDGYTKLWWILNAHFLAYVNRTSPDAFRQVLERIVPLYGVKYNKGVLATLQPIVEQFFKRLEEVTDSLDLSDCSVIGTSTYTTSLAASLFILRRIRQKHPQIKTIMGGGAFADDLALGSDNLDTLLNEYDFIDHVVLGEGENLLLKILQGELAHKRAVSISDIGGEALKMIDVPSPDFSDLDSQNYYHLTIEGARSCPFQCSFCSETTQWGDYRKKPADLFADQVIGLAEKHNNKAFFMGDSLMNPYIVHFARELLNKKANILYDGYLRADKPVTRADFVSEWARSGLYRVRMGIESAARRVLDAMDKMTTPEVISDALKTLSSAGIRTTTYWIMGFPGETEEDFQETLDFIRDHHPYIYELEAHPFYYYPYGQVGSRLYKSYPLYPEEVTDIIRFKVWEVADSNPSRAERYARLHRISELASELGLPNIYTMAERYAAEERWHRLHPTAFEVFEGSCARRSAVHLTGAPREVFSQERKPSSAGLRSNAESALCYQVAINKKLDEEILNRAANNLRLYNEALQMRLENGEYARSLTDDQSADINLVSVYDCRGEDQLKTDSVTREIVEKLTAEISPNGGDSFRIALINKEHNACDLVFIAHRAIVDATSVLLLSEDLFRMYEQLANGLSIMLLAPQKTLQEFLEHNSSFQITTQEGANEGTEVNEPLSPEIRAKTFKLGGELKKKLFSKALNNERVRPAEVVLAAMLRSLAGTVGGNGVPVDLKADHRLADGALQDTVGALIKLYPLHLDSALDSVSVDQAREMLTLPASGSNGTASDAFPKPRKSPRILLNLEYFAEEPWLGGVSWAPQGFVIDRVELKPEYLMAVAPVVRADGIQVHLTYQDTEDAQKLVDTLTGSLVGEVTALLDDCSSRIAAKRFWFKQFNNHVPGSNLQIQGDISTTQGEGWDAVDCEMERPPLDRTAAALNTDLSTLLLAAYSTLLSRLNGKEDVVVVSCVDRPISRNLAPLRLEPFWHLGFEEYVRAVEQEVKLVSQYAAYPFHALGAAEGYPQPVLDVGFIFGEDTESFGDEALRVCQQGDHSLNLVLAANANDGVCTLRFIYRCGSFERKSIESVADYLRTIIDALGAERGIHLGDIALGRCSSSDDATSTLAQQAFSF